MTRRLPHLVDRADIVKWADRVDARAEFPRLVRGLIRATNDQVSSLQMRAAEGTDVPGYDGTSDAFRATPFVPAGPTVWELGVGGDPGDKAQHDYRLRTDNPLGIDCAATTFAFVTAREWRAKEEWALRRRAEGIWADVRAFDVDDIEQALEQAPAVHHRFSEVAGKPSHGAQSLDEWWGRFRRLSSPMLDPEMVLSGRADAAAELLMALEGAPRQSTVSAVSTDEVIAFVAATVLSTEGELQQDLLDRALIVKDTYTLNLLDRYTGLLILIPYDEELRREARLVHNHHVVVRADDGAQPTISLAPIDPAGFQALLEERGILPERARDLARFARRSVEAFQRAASAPGAELAPAWASLLTTPVSRRSWLAAKWDERRSGDRDALAEMFAESYEEAREQLVRLTGGADPMMVMVGSTWAVASPEDAWRYGQPQLQPADLVAFEGLVQTVLGAVDPRLDLPVDQRWLAAVHGKSRIHSSDLRDGVAGVLALLGARGDEVAVGSGTVGSWLRHALWQLFERANLDATGHLWASLSDVMPLLAEAVPDVFLNAVQVGLHGDRPLVGRLFADDESDSFTASSPHTGLLWALENLAWSPEHFALAVDVLARLAAIDPGGRLSNRPIASLADIYRSWLPQTSVSLDRRLRVLDALRLRHPTISWPLLLTMLPERNAIGGYTHSPRYRDWKPDDNIDQIDAETVASCAAAGDRVVDDAGLDGDRWAALAARFDDLPPDGLDRAISALDSLGSDPASAQVRMKVWAPLHALVVRHQRYAHLEWAMTRSRTERLDALQRRLAPDDVGVRIQWLFDDHLPDLPEESGLDFESERYLGTAARRRSAAIDELIASAGLDGVCWLARHVKYPGFVGVAVADARVDEVGRALLDFIDGDDPKLVDAATAWATRTDSANPGWALSTEPHFAGRALAQGRILNVSLDLPAAWALARRDDDVDAAYWAEFSPYGRGHGFELANEAARQLLDHDRPRTALALLNLYGDSGGAGAQLIVEGLEALVQQPPHHTDTFRVDGHDLEHLLDLARTADVPRDRLARLEWALRPALGHRAHSPILERRLADDPSFFVEVLSIVFKARRGDERTDVPPHLAQNAYQLLADWNVVPGTNDSGVLDSGALDAWVDEAVRLATDADRLDVALDQIGKVLAKAPSDADGSWPARPVRQVIERVANAELDDGFRVQILNSRGVQTRSLTEGGDRERQRGRYYLELADLAADDAPRTAAVLRSVASSYKADASHFDEQVQRLSEGLDI